MQGEDQGAEGLRAVMYGGNGLQDNEIIYRILNKLGVLEHACMYACTLVCTRVFKRARVRSRPFVMSIVY